MLLAYLDEFACFTGSPNCMVSEIVGKSEDFSVLNSGVEYYKTVGLPWVS